MPREYRLRMFSVHAEQLTPQTLDEVSVWCGGQIKTEIDPFDKTQRFVALNIPTLEGVKRAQEGDYVIRVPTGVFDVMPAQAFHRRFEEA